MKTPNYPLAIVVIACLAVFAVNLEILPVNIMEARNFITAREMLQDDNWIFTTINGVERYQKPPLPTWLTAISAAIFGLESLFGLRLPAVLITLLLAIYFYKLIEKITQRKVLALVSSLILITSFYVTFSGRNGQWDIFTHSFIWMAIYYLYQFFEAKKTNYVLILWAALLVGASFMSKGPVAIYALLLPFLIAYGVVFKFKKLPKKAMAILLFLILATVASGWWYWYVYSFDTEAVARITSKETTNWTHYNVRPFYYYWSFFVQSGLWTIPAFVGLLYPYLKNKVSHKKGYQLSVLWTLLAVVLLSIIPEKKSRYLLPVLLPMAMSTGFYIEYLMLHFSQIKNKWAQLPVYLHFSILGIIGALSPLGILIYFGKALLPFAFPFSLLFLFSTTIGLYIFRKLYQKNIASVFYASICLVVAIICFGLPLMDVTNQNPKYLAMESLIKEEIKVYDYSRFSPEYTWLSGGKMKIVASPEGKLYDNNLANIPFLVLVDPREQALFTTQFKARKPKFIKRYDLNRIDQSSKSYKDRLVRYLYFVGE